LQNKQLLQPLPEQQNEQLLQPSPEQQCQQPWVFYFFVSCPSVPVSLTSGGLFA
jgi:hypothetical protein